jgi:hypothetical protein
MADLRYHDHNELVRELLLWLHENFTGRYWENPTGGIQGQDRFVKYGLPGSTDIIGHTGQGRAVYIEIKTKGGKLSVKKNKPDQVKFKKMVLRSNCIHIVARENYKDDPEFNQLQRRS